MKNNQTGKIKSWGKNNGIIKKYHSNGQLSLDGFDSKGRHTWIYYKDDGSLDKEEYYEDRKLISTKHY